MKPGCSLSLLRIQLSFSSGFHVVLAAAQVQSGNRTSTGSLESLSLKKMSCLNMNIQEWNFLNVKKIPIFDNGSIIGISRYLPKVTVFYRISLFIRYH